VQLTPAQKQTFKVHATANTNTTPATAADGSPLTAPFVINTRLATNNADDERAIAEWYNAAVTGAENQAFATPNELWVREVEIQPLNAAIDWGTQIPHGLSGSPTVSEQYLARVYKMLAWQSLTWNSRLDMTDAQQRAGVMNTFNSVLNTPTATTTAIAAVGTGRKVPTRLERLFAGAAVGQAGVGGAIGRVCPASVYGQTVSQPDVHDALVNG
jgi:hypothetical protein